MSATTITKIEKLDRRITIDEMAALAAALDLGPTRTALLLPRDVQAGNLIKDFVAERRLERPYHVEVNGFTSRPDNIALYIGEAALKIHREERGDG